MTRDDFIQHVKTKYADKADSDQPVIYFDMLFTDVDNSGIFGLMYVNSKLEDVYNELNISNGYLLTKKDIEFRFDYDYSEENEDDEFCRYTSELNLNILYDKLVLNKNIVNHDLIDLYRIETSDDRGLYSGIGYNILLNAEEHNHPGPDKEKSFHGIFDNRKSSIEGEYKNKWSFAFHGEQQMKDWLSNRVVFDLLVEHNFQLKKLTLNSSNVIIGHSQAIYIKDAVEKAETLSLKSIEHLFNTKIKNKLSI